MEEVIDNQKIINDVNETEYLYDPKFYEPNIKRKFRDDFRFIVVSAKLPFALTDVWAGYCGALQRHGFRVLPMPTHNLIKFMAEDVSWKYIHSKILDIRDNFTHVIFIGGGDNTVPWMLDSLYDKKSILIATEDPHGLDRSSEFSKLYSYYFTNEKNVCKHIARAKYLPTAGDHYACMPIKKEDLPEDIFCDVLFVGNVYPNRQKVLEDIIPLVEKKGYKFQICGISGFADKDSPIRKYIRKDMNGLIEHNMNICLYNAAKIIININRDPFWETTGTSSNKEFKCEGYSMNPRFYEIGLCGKFQLIDDSRQEVFKMFKCNQGIDSEIITYHDGKDLTEKIEYYLQHEEERENIAFNFHQKVVDGHTYLNRVTRLINYLNLTENPQEGIKGILKSAQCNKK